MRTALRYLDSNQEGLINGQLVYPINGHRNEFPASGPQRGDDCVIRAGRDPVPTCPFREPGRVSRVVAQAVAAIPMHPGAKALCLSPPVAEVGFEPTISAL
jgi:hypothetical protein